MTPLVHLFPIKIHDYLGTNNIQIECFYNLIYSMARVDNDQTFKFNEGRT